MNNKAVISLVASTFFLITYNTIYELKKYTVYLNDRLITTIYETEHPYIFLFIEIIVIIAAIYFILSFIYFQFIKNKP
jgi:hypothetical protein